MIKQPTNEQIKEVKDLISTCIRELVLHDSDIFNIELNEPIRISKDAKF